MSLHKLGVLIPFLALILSVSGAYAIQVSANADNGGVSLPITAPTCGSVNGQINIQNGVPTASITGSGTLDPTYWIMDGKKKKALVHAEITASSYQWQAKIAGGAYSYTSTVNDPTPERSYTIPGTGATDVTAEQWISATGISALNAYAQAWTKSDTDPNRYAKSSIVITDSSGTGSISGTDNSPSNAIINAFYQVARATVATTPVGNTKPQAYTESRGTAAAPGGTVITEATGSLDASNQYNTRMTVTGSTGHNINTQGVANTKTSLYQAKDTVESTTTGTASSVSLEDSVIKDGDTLRVTVNHNPSTPAAFSYSPIISSSGSLLRDTATAAVNGDEIVVDPGFYIEQTVNIDKDLNITGSTDTGNPTYIDGSDLNPLFNILPGAEVTLSHLTIQSGLDTTYGGAIKNSGILNIADSYLTGNHGKDGGALMNLGTATLTNVEVSDNMADHRGGGVYNALGATMNIDGSNIHHNIASDTGHTTGSGGGIANYGTANVYGATIISNNIAGVSKGQGGGILNMGEIHVYGASTISNNFAYDGAGVFNGGSTAAAKLSSIVDSTLSANGNISGSYDPSWDPGVHKFAFVSVVPAGTKTQEGGAVANYEDSEITLTNNTIGSNTAEEGGAISNWGTSHLTDNTIDSNSASLAGGAIFNRKNTLELQGGNTISNNQVTTMGDGYGGNSQFYGAGGGIWNWGATITASGVDNILSGNTAPRYADAGGLYNYKGVITNPTGSLTGQTPWYEVP